MSSATSLPHPHFHLLTITLFPATDLSDHDLSDPHPIFSFNLLFCVYAQKYIKVTHHHTVNARACILLCCCYRGQRFSYRNDACSYPNNQLLRRHSWFRRWIRTPGLLPNKCIATLQPYFFSVLFSFPNSLSFLESASWVLAREECGRTTRGL